MPAGKQTNVMKSLAVSNASQVERWHIWVTTMVDKTSFIAEKHTVKA